MLLELLGAVVVCAMPCIINCYWFPSEVVPVDVSGRSFERMSILRRSCIDCGSDGVRRRTGKKKIRGKRRNTIAGTDHKELEAIVGSSATNNHLSEDMTSSGISVNTSDNKKSHIETIKEWGRTRLRQIRNLDAQVKLRAKVDTLARKKWDREDPQHSSSGNWSASSESGSTVTSHQPRSSISSGSVCNKHGTILPLHRRLNASASSSVTSGDSTIHDEGETCSTYSCDTEGYYTSFHMDSGLKTLREEEPIAALTTTTALSESHLNDSLGQDSEYELFGRGSTSTTASSAGTVCTTLLSPVPPPPLPERTSSALSNERGESNHSRTLPERKDTNTGDLNNEGDVPCKTQSLKYDKKLTQYVDRTARLLAKQNGAKQLTLTKENINKLKQLAEEDSRYQQASNNRSLITVDVHHGKTQGSPEKCEGSPDSGHNTCSSPVDSVTETPSSMCDFELSECSDLEGLDRVERIRSKTTINSSRIPSMCVITPPQSDDETSLKLCGALDDSGDYVTIRDISTISDIETDPVPLDCPSAQQEYVSLNELGAVNGSSLERKRTGAKVTLDATGKVIYSSESLRRRRKIHTTNTFEPGPCVAKPVSPVAQGKQLTIRPVTISANASHNNGNTSSLITNDLRSSPLPARIRERMNPLGTLSRDLVDQSPRPLAPRSSNVSPGPGKQVFSSTSPNVPSTMSKPISPLVSGDRKLDPAKASSVVYPIGCKLRAPIVKAANSPTPHRTIKGAYVKINASFLETSIDEPDKKLMVKRSDSYRLANQENIPGPPEAAVTAGEDLLDAIRLAARSNSKGKQSFYSPPKLMCNLNTDIW